MQVAQTIHVTSGSALSTQLLFSDAPRLYGPHEAAQRSRRLRDLPASPSAPGHCGEEGGKGRTWKN